jgi:hypothetical protein
MTRAWRTALVATLRHRAGQALRRTMMAALGVAALGASPALAQSAAGTASVVQPNKTSMTYTAPTQPGTYAFDYTVSDGRGGTATAKVFVTVTGAPPPATPVVGDVNATVDYNSSNNLIALNIISGNVDHVNVVQDVQHGSTAVSGTTIRYTPTPGPPYINNDIFSYNATGPGGTSNTAYVSIAIREPPVPIAGQPPTLNVAYNGSGTVTLLPGGYWTSVAISRYPSHGSLLRDGPLHDGLNATYSNVAGGGSTNGSGSDSFDYTVTGPGGTSAPTTVNITVAAAPPPVMTPSSITVNYNSAATADLLYVNPTTSVSIVTPPTQGSAFLTSTMGWQATYTPNNGVTGQNVDNFYVQATGPGGTSAPVKVTVNVNPPPQQAPTAGGATNYVDQDSQDNPMTLSLGGGSATSVSVVQGPTHGFTYVSGVTIYYTPSTGWHGVDSFTYNASNAVGTSATAMVLVHVMDPSQ